MPGFDWNGNGKSDAFDHFMDMKIISDSSDNNVDSYLEDNDTSDYSYTSGASGYVSHVSDNTYESVVDPNIDFAEHLKNSIRSPEDVKLELDAKKNDAMYAEAKLTLRDIKCALIYNAKAAKYIVSDGIKMVYCFCSISQRFMQKKRSDNANELKQNNQTFFLFRNPNLQYMTWNNYEIVPEYREEFKKFLTALKQLAAKEKIEVECVVYNGRDNKYVPFPSKSRNDYSYGWTLCVRATAKVGVASTDTVSTTSTNQTIKSPQLYSDNNNEQSETPSNASVIAKSLLVIGLCVGALVLSISADLGKLGIGLCLIGAAIVGYHILKG